MLFLGKLLKGVVYIKDQISLYIARRRGYSYLSNDEINGLPSNRNRQTSLYTKITDWIFGRNTRTNIPLYETRTSYINMNRSQDNISRDTQSTPTPLSPQSSHADTDFERHLQSDMMNSTDFHKPRSMMSSSLYPPPPLQNMNSSSMNVSSIYTQTDTLSRQESLRQESPRQESQSKPFNVEDSNLLLNSQFLTKMLQPFQSQKLEEEKVEINIIYNNEENDKEFEEELLKNPYV